MSETYDAIYAAVRSKIQGDVGTAVENVMREQNFSFYFKRAMSCFGETAGEMMRPSVLFRPKIFRDGNQWCALYGEDLQNGVAGFGDSPAEAMHDFDKSWNAKLPKDSP